MKDKLLDFIFFIVGTFISIISLATGFYSSNFGLSGGFKESAAFFLAIGICLIVFGFLRRNWRKHKSNTKT